MRFHLLFFLIGVAFFVGGILILIHELKKRKKTTAQVTATVSQYFTEISHDSNEGGTTVTHYPIMRYYVLGSWYERRSETGWNKQKYPVGENLDILYNPNCPEEFRLPGENTALIASIIGIVLGVAVCILAFVL